MSALRRTAAITAAAFVLAGCASSSNDGWEGAAPGRTEANPVQITPIVPAQPPGGGANGNGSSTPNPPPPGSSSKPPGSDEDPAVVAKHLTAPTGVAVLPDGSALVGERTTGEIHQVQPVAGQPTPVVKTLTGLDAQGDGGLLDLALSPHYLEDNLVYAYITTPTDNRVVDFTIDGPVTPVLTGIPKGPTGNAGRIAFDSSGLLYIGTGDAGNSALASNSNSLAGKVLRITDIGEPAPGNPSASSPIYTRGHSGATGVCAVTDATQVFEVEPRANGLGEVNLLAPGSSYGWPRTTPASKAAAALMPTNATAPGGCAVSGETIYVASRDGKRLLASTLNGTGRAMKPKTWRIAVGKKYGRLLTVVVAPDGSIWLTTSNKDGHGTPVADDERVIRIVFQGGGGESPA